MDRTALMYQLVEHEDLRLKPYRCTSGKLTIGVGRNLDDVGISRREAMFLLEGDIDRVTEDLDERLPWWREMSDTRQLVIADMCFNLGIARLLKFVNTLAAMKRGDYEAAAQGMEDSLWYRQVKGRAVKLVDMMRKG